VAVVKAFDPPASSAPKWHVTPGWFITPEIDGLAVRGEIDHRGRGPCECRSRHNEGGCNVSARGVCNERSSSGFVHQRLRGNAGQRRGVRVIVELAVGLGEALPGYTASEIAGEWPRDTGETTPAAEGPSTERSKAHTFKVQGKNPWVHGRFLRRPLRCIDYGMPLSSLYVPRRFLSARIQQG